MTCSDACRSRVESGVPMAAGSGPVLPDWEEAAVTLDRLLACLLGKYPLEQVRICGCPLHTGDSAGPPACGLRPV